MNIRYSFKPAFTIVELIVVIVVLGILAGIVIAGYGNWRTSVAKKAVQSDLQMVAAAMEGAKNFENGYPTSLPSSFKASSNVTITYYSGSASDYCIDGVSTVNSSVRFFIDTTKGKKPISGTCVGGEEIPGSGPDGAIATGDHIQIVKAANCPTTRTMLVDARDNRTYWVQKLADGKCWMLTNLAYGGGGTNTYGDVKPVTQSSNYSFGLPYYYIPTGANPTTSPTQPSISTDGTGQYGYLYNWCAAMGGQATVACYNDTYFSSAPAVNPAISICPFGWRLPTGGSTGGDFAALNTAINSGSTTSDSGLRTTWMIQRAGYWNMGGYSSLGNTAAYWSSSHSITLQGFGSAPNWNWMEVSEAYGMEATAGWASFSEREPKHRGLAVRCVVN